MFMFCSHEKYRGPLKFKIAVVMNFSQPSMVLGKPKNNLTEIKNKRKN